MQSPDDENNKRPPELGGQGAAKSAACTKGVAMSFGFKRRPTTAPAIASNASAARRLANADVANGNDTVGSDDGGVRVCVNVKIVSVPER